MSVRRDWNMGKSASKLRIFAATIHAVFVCGCSSGIGKEKQNADAILTDDEEVEAGSIICERL